MLLNYLQVFAYAQLVCVVSTSKDVLNVTVLLDIRDGNMTVSSAGAGFLVAKDTIIKRKLLPNYTINWVMVETDCRVSALRAFIPVWKGFVGKVHGVIGPGCSEACRSIGLFTAAFEIPEVSHFCTSNTLSQRRIYSTFARTVGDISVDVPQLLQMAVKELGWRNFYIIATRWGPWLEVAYDIKLMLDNTTLPDYDTILTSQVLIVDTEHRFTKDTEDVLNEIQEQNKPALIILCLYKESAYEIIQWVTLMSFSRRTYAFILLDKLLVGVTDTELLNLLDGTLVLSYGKGIIDVFERFQLSTFAAYKKDEDLQKLVTLHGPSQVTVEDALLHDAFLLWAIAVNQTKIPQNKPLSEAWSGMAVVANIPRVQFDGASGFLKLTPNGERVTNYTLGVIYKGQIVPILVQQNATGKWEFYKDGLKRIGWENLRLVPGLPLYDNKALEAGLITFWVIMMILTSLSALGIIFSKCHYEVELKSIQYIMLDFDKIHLISVDQPDSSPRRSLLSKSETEPVRVNSLGDVRPVSASASAKNLSRTVKTCTAYYEDTKIWVKIFQQRRSFHIKDRKLSVEFLQLWKLNHPNINSFIGACVFLPAVHVCMQYCSRGSVSDIIEKKTIKLTPEFRLALAIDIAQGMKHLHHSPIVSHGHLTSTNCVIDDQWTCKITDHGICQLRSEFLHSPDDDDKDTNRLLWTAPELLHLVPKKRPICGSQMSDVYSFGIILQELCYETQPFGELCQSLGPRVIVFRVKTGEDPPFRPLAAFHADNHIPLWTLLMQDCWNQNPWLRPAFSEIILRLTIISGGKLINPVDTVIKMLEEHTQKLEEIVHKRSEMLFEEKQKAESLLYSILPIQVAEELKQGNKVNPEAFDAVTVYVSDIVEFTPLAASSTAIQVINLLSILFNMFDKLTDTFGVYKLETIGDAYVVAGGLPERNGDFHATQIASLALHILSSIFTFKIPHLPERPLQIRTGINTAMTINVSDTTAQLLLNSKQFELEKLEDLEVFEGDRKITVYRLLSLQNLDLPMPTTTE